MKRPQAQIIARRIESIWPALIQWSEARTEEWIETLEYLDEGAAGTAIAKLRATHDKCPTMAELTSATKALKIHDASTRVDCNWCGGDGWETLEYTAHGLPNSGVQPCRCKNGDERRDVHRRIIGLNDNQLGHDHQASHRGAA